MSACFHIPGVACDNCRTGLRDDRPYVATVTTGGTYYSSQDFLAALRQVEIERDEARKEAAKYKQLHDMEADARMDNPLARMSATAWKRRHAALANQITEVRAWVTSRIHYCEEVMARPLYAMPRPDIPLEPVERRGELQALKAVLAILDGKEEP